jgi:hypothetical protein
MDSDSLSIMDLLALIRKLLIDALTRNATDKAEIERIRAEVIDAPDAAVIQMARDTIARIDEKATAFLERSEDAADRVPGES